MCRCSFQCSLWQVLLQYITALHRMHLRKLPLDVPHCAQASCTSLDEDPAVLAIAGRVRDCLPLPPPLAAASCFSFGTGPRLGFKSAPNTCAPAKMISGPERR